MACPFITERIMKCPNCPDVTLAISERQGVELDYCPECRGVWLDRGELDKLLDRTAAAQTTQSRPLDDGYSAQQGSHHRAHRDEYAPRRRKSWLGDLFD